jgi:hypothetical protein
VTGTYSFTGSEQFPTIEVGAATLVKDIDYIYTVTSTDNGNTTSEGINAGTVTFSIVGLGDYVGTVSDLTFVIGKANPTVETPTGITAVFGQELSQASALGERWTWEAPETSVGAVGNKNFDAIYTPTDTRNYNQATRSVTVSVSKASPTWTQAGVYAYTFGDRLDSIVLNETASTLGTFTFETPDATPNAGTTTVTVIFTPSDGASYETVSFNLSITVAKVSFDMSGITFVGASFVRDGEAKSIFIEGALPAGVNVSYTNNARTATGIYTVTATFTVDDGVNFNTPAPMTATLTITPHPDDGGGDKDNTAAIVGGAVGGTAAVAAGGGAFFFFRRRRLL